MDNPSTDPNTLISAYLDGAGELTPEQAEALERWINASEANAAEFVRRSFADQDIRTHLIAEQSAQLVFDDGLADPTEVDADTAAEPDIMSEVVDQALALRRQHEIEDEANRRLAAQQAEDARNRRLELRRRQAEPEAVNRVVVIPQLVVWLGLAAVLGIVATIYYQTNQPRPAVTNPPPVARDSPQPGGSVAAVPVADLAESFDAAWMSSRPNTRGELLPGRYTLTHGWARVRTHHGVDLVLEAPVTVALGEGNAVVLSRGQLVADVPDRAHGFTVQTPGGRVVDYGTTFGVAVSDVGETMTHVFAGEVEVASTGNAGAGVVRLVEDQAASLRRGGVVERAEAAPERFALEVPATAYQAAVMKSRPMCYWRGPIDEATRRVTDHGWLGAHGWGTPALRHRRAGYTAEDMSGSLDFGRSDAAAVTIQPHQQFDLDRSFTIEAWCWIEPGHEGFMRIVSTRFEGGGFGLGINGTAVDNSIGDLPTNVPVLTFFEQADFVGEVVLPEGRWVHLAAVVDDAGRVAMYVDGAPITVDERDHSTQATAAPGDTPLMIGRNPYTGRGIQAWQGRLDEVAIYDRALSGDEVLHHVLATEGP